MEKKYENMYKYGEQMKGKFSHRPDGNGIIISVTSPFVKEIYIECDADFSDQYYRTYSLLEPQADHPEGDYREIYYHTQEKCYYRSEWREKNPEQQESKSGYIWIRTNNQYIVEHAQKCEKLQAHFRMYRSIHKGQLCVFRCYAIDPNGQCKRPSTIDSMFDRHKWFYDPFSFEVALLDENTIDAFVEKTPISKEMTNQMVRHYKLEDKALRRANRRKWRRSLLDNISKFAQFVERHSALTVGIIGAIVGSLCTFFLQNIGTILNWFFKQAG